MKKDTYTGAIIVMFCLFFMIAFVTNLAGSMGVVVTNQFGASKALSQFGGCCNSIGGTIAPIFVGWLAYLLFYALKGCKNVNRDIPTE